jgi:hypothetical protein
MENTARKMSADEVVKTFQEAHGNLDLLRVFVITGATDISKSHEMISKWGKNAHGEEKAKWEQALATLQAIELKRIEYTAALYQVDQPEIKAIEADETEGKTVLMFPTVEVVLERVQKIFDNSKDMKKAIASATKVLNETVGQGKAVDEKGNPETWDEKKIADRVGTFAAVKETPVAEVPPAKTEKTKEDKKTEKIEFQTLYDMSDKMVKEGKSADEIKIALMQFTYKKVIADKAGDIFVRNEQVFNDYYGKILKVTVEAGASIKAAEKLNFNDANKLIEEKIEKEVKPFLEHLDKDEKESSPAKATKLLVGIYKNLGRNKSLQDGLNEVIKLAEKWAPGLVARYRDSNKSTVPVDNTAATVIEDEKPDIYDDSHNVKESNKVLWAEVEAYTMMDELFNKSVELCKAGTWKDALSMCIILITTGKIKETADAKDPLQWNEAQIKEWFHANILGSLKTGDATGDEKPADTEKPAAQQGPVPQAGSIDKTSEKVVRLMHPEIRDRFKGKYETSTCTIPIIHHSEPSLSVEVLVTTPEQEKEFIGTEANLTKFIDELRDQIVLNRNAANKDMRKRLQIALKQVYEITNSETKNILDAIIKEADAIRRENKKNSKPADTNAPEAETADDEEGSVWYDKLEVGETIEETVNGKKVPMADGACTITDPSGKEFGVEVKDGKIISVEPFSDATAQAEGNPPAAESAAPESTTEETASTTLEATASDTPAEQVSSDMAKTETSPLPETPVDTKKSEGEKKPKETDSKEQNTATESTAGEGSTNGNNAKRFEGFEDILKAKQKLDFNKAISVKVATYADEDEGIKSVFDMLKDALKSTYYKKGFHRNYKNSPDVDLLATVKGAVEKGKLVAAAAK